MDYKYFKVKIQEKIAFVSIDRADKANSLNLKGWEEMHDLFNSLSTDKAVRVVVFSGEGKLFCAGIDLSLLMSVKDLDEVKCHGRRAEEIQALVFELQAAVSAIENCKKPVLAAIHSGCIGGGLDISAACDMRYCTGDAYFVIKEIDMGMVADLGTLQRLPKFVKPAVVTEMALTGRKVYAEEARDIGLVNQVFGEKEEMLQEVTKLAEMIAAKSPLSIRGTKEILRYSRDHSVAEGLQYMSVWNSAMLLSDDLKESFSALMEKRKTEFAD